MTTDDPAFELVAADGLRLSFTPIRDWTMLHPELRGTPFQLYAIMRSLVIDKGDQPSRRITIDQLCWLLPGINGKPTSETAVKDALKVLDRLSLVTNPDSERLVTSTGKGGIEVRRRFQINDLPPEGFQGWRNAWDKLDRYREDWRTSAPKPPAIRPASTQPEGSGSNPPAPEVAFEGRNSDPRADQAGKGEAAGRFKGRNSGLDHRNSGFDHRNSDRDGPSDLQERASNKSLKEGSLSPAAAQASDATPNNPGEREDLAGPNTPNPADAIVQAWIQARAGEPVPVSAPSAVRRSAHELLAEGIDADLLRAAAADMARHGWVNLRKHLEHWTPPRTPAQTRTEATTGRTATDCPWCDPWGWYEPQHGGEARCTHPDNPPASHPAANQTRSAA